MVRQNCLTHSYTPPADQVEGHEALNPSHLQQLVRKELFLGAML